MMLSAMTSSVRIFLTTLSDMASRQRWLTDVRCAMDRLRNQSVRGGGKTVE